MTAIDGSTGIGLFVAFGATVATTGSDGVLPSYALIESMVHSLMTSLGEMAAYMPVSGSLCTYGSRFIEDGLGFALGWSYWYNWAVAIAAELVAAQLVVNFWFPEVPGIYWSVIFLGIMFDLNVIPARGFGESRPWFTLIEVAMVVVFISVGLAAIFGIMHSVELPGLNNSTMGDAPFVGGFQAMVGVAMIAGFSFQGTELIGIAAGELGNPWKNIPIVIRQVFRRTLMFYILVIFVIDMLISHTDPNPLESDASGISVSSFTLLFERAGFAAAAGVTNAVVLSVIFSVGNSGIYVLTRMLYNLALEGKAPHPFSRVSRSSVSRNALYATTLAGVLCFLTSAFGDSTVYTWLLNTLGMCDFIAWLGIAISRYRLRKGYLTQGGRPEDLPYRAELFLFGLLLTSAPYMVITPGQNYQAPAGERIDWIGLLATHISPPLFLAIWLGYRWEKRACFVRYHEMDVSPTNT